MLDNRMILNLYENVIKDDIFHFKLHSEQIIVGIDSMRDVYKPELSNLTFQRSCVANYNDPAHRCAYLHKYACFHTALVRDMFHEAVQLNFRLFYDTVFSTNNFRICCLGGGPGNDVIAILSVLHHSFSFFPSYATVIDYMSDWRITFSSILRELCSGQYGAFGNNTYYLNWEYLQANLLQTLSPVVADAIFCASIITMVKFVSATACVDTKTMIHNIFTAMKPGGLMFFIDNDGGGYHQLIAKVAKKHNFITLFECNRQTYIANDMRVRRFGRWGCSKSNVAVLLLQKPVIDFYNENCDYDYRQLSTPLLNNPYCIPHLAREVVFNTPGYDPTTAGEPLTPYIHVASNENLSSNIDFTRNYDNSSNNFIVSREEIAQSPRLCDNRVNSGSTPLRPTHQRKKKMKIGKRLVKNFYNVKRKLKHTFHALHIRH